MGYGSWWLKSFPLEPTAVRCQVPGKALCGVFAARAGLCPVGAGLAVGAGQPVLRSVLLKADETPWFMSSA